MPLKLSDTRNYSFHPFQDWESLGGRDRKIIRTRSGKNGGGQMPSGHAL